VRRVIYRPQLKILQDGIALMVFQVFSIAVRKKVPCRNDLPGILLNMAGLAMALLRMPSPGGRG
jgi:uncharacterized protein (DUF486 family)